MHRFERHAFRVRALLGPYFVYKVSNRRNQQPDRTASWRVVCNDNSKLTARGPVSPCCRFNGGSRTCSTAYAVHHSLAIRAVSICPSSLTYRSRRFCQDLLRITTKDEPTDRSEPLLSIVDQILTPCFRAIEQRKLR